MSKIEVHIRNTFNWKNFLWNWVGHEESWKKLKKTRYIEQVTFYPNSSFVLLHACFFFFSSRYLWAHRSGLSRKTSPSSPAYSKRPFPTAMSNSSTGPRRSTGQSPLSLSSRWLKTSTSKSEKVCTRFPKFPNIALGPKALLHPIPL